MICQINCLQNEHKVDHAIELIPDSVPPYRPTLQIVVPRNEWTQISTRWSDSQEFHSTKQRVRLVPPVLFVKKKGLDPCDCASIIVQLNKITIKNRYSIALESTNCLTDWLMHECFPRSIYALATTKSESSNKTFPKLHFELDMATSNSKFCPFGLKPIANKPATFMGLMNEILRSFLEQIRSGVSRWYSCLQSQRNRTHSAFESKCCKHCVQINCLPRLSKCKFVAKQVEFLGYLFDRTLEFMWIRTKSKLWLSVGPNQNPCNMFVHSSDWNQLLSQIRTWILSTVAAPLTELLKKQVPFGWNEPEQACIWWIENTNWSSAPVLAVPNPEIPFVIVWPICIRIRCWSLCVDLQNEQTSCIRISQTVWMLKNELSNSRKRTLLDHCFTLSKPGDSYLEGLRFTIRTDHASLRFIKHSNPHFPNDTSSLGLEFLQQFDFEIVYKPGKSNVVADALSPTTWNKNQIRSTNITWVSYGSDMINQIKTHSHWRSWLWNCVFNRLNQSDSKDSKYRIRDGLFDFRTKSSVCSQNRTNSIQNCVWSSRFCWFLDIWDWFDKTYELVQRHYYWPPICTLTFETTYSVATSVKRNKDSNQHPAGLLQPLAIPNKRWNHISVDFIMQLPNDSQHKFDAIVVFVWQIVSKMTHFIPTKSSVTATWSCNNLCGFCVSTDIGITFNSCFWSRSEIHWTHFWQSPESTTWSEIDPMFHWHFILNPMVKLIEWTELSNPFCSVSSISNPMIGIASWVWVEFAYKQFDQLQPLGMSPFYLTYGHHPIHSTLHFDESNQHSSCLPLPNLQIRWFQILKFATDSINSAQGFFSMWNGHKM